MTPTDPLAADDAIVAEAGKRADAATPGPWMVDRLCIQAPDGNVALVNLARASAADATLCAAARTDIPALAAIADKRGRALREAMVMLERHRPYKVYDECDHDHSPTDAGVVEVEEVGLTCEEGLVQTICYDCDTDDGEVREDSCDGEWPCDEAKSLARIREILGGE